VSPQAGLAAARRLTVKVGSSQLVGWETGAPRLERFEAVAADIAALRARGVEIVLVSSGAVALGRPRLGLSARRPLSLEEKQAAAAAGQTALIQTWERAFAPHGFPAAQALLSPSDTENRGRWLNSRNTLSTLLALGAVPVVNENDTVATEELRYGDNDRLAARTAQLAGADLLVILSDVDGLYDADPARNPGARHIPRVERLTETIRSHAGAARADSPGTGGMATKLAAAEISTQAGCAAVIARGDAAHPLLQLETGGRATWFPAATSPARARRAWIAAAVSPSGRLTLDAGALAAVRSGASLLPAGVHSVDGRFSRGEPVRLLAPDGTGVATGLPAYDSEECRRIAGRRSGEIEALLGYRRGAALVHADDLVLDDQADGDAQP